MSADPSFVTKGSAYAVGTAVADSDTVDLRNARGARILVPTGVATISLTAFETDDAEGSDSSTWYECTDVGAISVAAGESVAVPDAMFACGNVRFVGDVAGTIRVVRKG